MSPASTSDMMTVAAARELRDGQVCFVGIGLPSLAANLARRLHAPSLVLIYESGTIGAKPTRPPLSIGDGELADTADTVVPMPEIFNYWLQGGHIDVGMLGTAQIDRFANLNTTVIGPYDAPTTRLPGAGGAPEIASYCKEAIVVVNQTRRSFVGELDFRTTVGFGAGRGDRERLGFSALGPSLVVTDVGLYRPDPDTAELVLTDLHPTATLEAAREATSWDLRVADELRRIEPPTTEELEALAALREGRP